MGERTLAFRIDEELYRRVRFKLAENGKTLRAYVLGLIEADLDRDEGDRRDAQREELLAKADEIIRQLQQFAGTDGRANDSTGGAV